MKVRLKLWGANEPKPKKAENPTYVASEAERSAWRYPALAWLDKIATRFGGRVVFVSVPAHIAGQPAPGSAKAARREECNARIAAIARRHKIPFIDFNIRSEITANDANWWDRLHYRLPIADRVVSDIGHALATGADDPNGDWRYVEDPGVTSLTAE